MNSNHAIAPLFENAFTRYHDADPCSQFKAAASILEKIGVPRPVTGSQPYCCDHGAMLSDVQHDTLGVVGVCRCVCTQAGTPILWHVYKCVCKLRHHPCHAPWCSWIRI